MTRINRIQPALPESAMKTYQVIAPLNTHWRKATCLEVDCQHYKHGWATTVTRGSEDEAIIRRAGRRFITNDGPDGFIQFMFYPEQPCFRESAHRVPLEREPLYLVKGGDWRGNPLGLPVVRHARGDDWVDDFANHQISVREVTERG